MLDLGTGTGAVLRELASRTHPPREVLGVDSSAAMLQRVPRLPDGWRVTEADVTDLPLPDGSVDVVSVSYVLHVLAGPTRRLAVGEMFRVLRPGGRAGVLVPALPRGALRRPYAAGLEWLLRVSESALGLSVIDATGDLQGAGFHVERQAFVRTGYPSVVTVAVRPDSGSARVAWTTPR